MHQSVSFLAKHRPAAGRGLPGAVRLMRRPNLITTNALLQLLCYNNVHPCSAFRPSTVLMQVMIYYQVVAFYHPNHDIKRLAAGHSVF